MGTVAVVLALAVRAGVQPVPCTDPVGCDLARVVETAACAPRAVKSTVRRVIVRVQHQVASAQRAAGHGEPHVSELRLARAAARVEALAERLATLAERGRVDGDCAEAVGREIAALGADLAALGAGPPTTTTTLATPRTTTTTTEPAGTTTSTTTSSTTTTTSACGNGRLDPGEQCDGTNLFGRDCLTLGFHGGGQLMCRPDCLFETRDCRR